MKLIHEPKNFGTDKYKPSFLDKWVWSCTGQEENCPLCDSKLSIRRGPISTLMDHGPNVATYGWEDICCQICDLKGKFRYVNKNENYKHMGIIEDKTTLELSSLHRYEVEKKQGVKA